MSWIKKLFQMFRNEEDQFEESQDETMDFHTPGQNQLETSKDINARVVYQYPKGQFRFPLIPDEKLESKGREQREKLPPNIQKVQEKNKSIAYPKQELRVPPRKSNLENERPKKRTPFRPTEIPSPIYGFERPKKEDTDTKQEKTPIEFELNSNINQMEELDLSFHSSPDIIDVHKEEELYPHQKRENLHVNELEASLEVSNEFDEIFDEHLENNEEQSLEQEVPQDIEAEDPAIEVQQEEVEQPSDPVRKHIPFNVIMLKNDKEKLEKKARSFIPEPLKAENPSVVYKKELTAAVEEVSPAVEKVSPFVQDEISYYQFPSKSLLLPPVHQEESSDWMKEQEQLLNSTLINFNVRASVVNVTKGPSVTRFEVQPEPGVKVNKITNLSDDIKLSLAARDIRIEAPIPGKHTIGIEVPNKTSRPVCISEIINSPVFTNSSSPLTAVLGLDIAGSPIVTDLRKMPHGLIAGATGSGKSVCINTILISLLYKATPEELKLLLIDPKMVELAPYNRIPHLVSPVITDVKAATAALKWAVDEMERRYELFAHTGVRDIGRFNELAVEHKQYADKLPYIVIIIDELADLMMMSPADVEEAICRIAQKARACGIHLIIATQRPSVDVITGLIKANVPTRIAFSVSSQIDSRTIIDISGAEKLLGRGDMLFLENGSSKPVRLQGTYVSDQEIDEVVAHVRRERDPEYLFEQEELLKKAQVIEEEDELFYEACEFVIDQGAASTSSLQRRFKVGYNRAARLIDMMEKQGFVSESRGSKPREVLITASELESLLDSSTIN